MSRRLLWIALLLPPCALLLGLLLWMSGPVDRCLDSGGSWDEEAQTCRR